MNGDWCFEHPWMTFFVALAAVEAIRVVGMAFARRGQR